MATQQDGTFTGITPSTTNTPGDAGTSVKQGWTSTQNPNDVPGGYGK